VFEVPKDDAEEAAGREYLTCVPVIVEVNAGEARKSKAFPFSPEISPPFYLIFSNSLIHMNNEPEDTTQIIILDRGMNRDECKAMCTSPLIPLREKLLFRMIYETTTRPR
jgi:hypothetical protein